MDRPGLRIAKFFLYIFGKCLAAFIALVIVVLGFFTALNTTNAMMVAKDAFSMRASAILRPTENETKAQLHKMFSNEYLSRSGLAVQMNNAGYHVENYVQRTDVAFQIVWSEQKSVELTVTDLVSEIRATVTDELTLFGEVDSFMDSGKYIVTIVKTSDDMWLVDNIEQVEIIKPINELPVPTPDPPVPEQTEWNEEEIIEEWDETIVE